MNCQGKLISKSLHTYLSEHTSANWVWQRSEVSVTVGEAVGGISGRAESSAAVIKQSHDIMTSHIMPWGTLKSFKEQKRSTQTAFSLCVRVLIKQNGTLMTLWHHTCFTVRQNFRNAFVHRKALHTKMHALAQSNWTEKNKLLCGKRIILQHWFLEKASRISKDILCSKDRGSEITRYTSETKTGHEAAAHTQFSPTVSDGALCVCCKFMMTRLKPENN